MIRTVFDGLSGPESVEQPATPARLPLSARAPAAAVLVPGGMFVTPGGTWIDEGSTQFFEALGDPDPDYDAPLFAVKNLGFILVRICPGALVEIVLHPRNVTATALASFAQCLRSIRSDRFRVRYLGAAGWASKTASSAAETIGWLYEACDAEDSGFERADGAAIRGGMMHTGAAALVH